MKVNGSTLYSPVARTAIICLPDSALERVNDIACEAKVTISNAFLQSEIQQEGLPRPYLKMIGSVSAIQGSFPCDVNTVSFESINQPEVHYEYQFSDEELSDLCKKGLFKQGFRCPDIFLNEFELPVTCDCIAVAPQLNQDAPLLFLDLKDSFSMAITKETSGYELSTYFEELKDEDVKVLDSELDHPMSVDQSVLKELLGAESQKEEIIVEEPIVEEEKPELTVEELVLQEAFENVEQRVSERIAEDPKPKIERNLPAEMEDIYQKDLDSGYITLDHDASDD